CEISALAKMAAKGRAIATQKKTAAKRIAPTLCSVPCATQSSEPKISFLLRPDRIGTHWPLNQIMFFGCCSRFCILMFQKAFAMQPTQFKKLAKSTVKAFAPSVVSGEVTG